MAAPGEKLLCVLQYHMSKSVVTVQRTFRAKYAKDLPTDKTIRAWYKQFLKLGVCASVCGKNLNMISMCALSPLVHTSNISSCEKKSVFLLLWTIPLR